MKRSFFILSLCILGFWETIFAINQPLYQKTVPWFTGPLLAPAGHTTPPGMLNLEPYLTIQNIFGRYDDNWKAHNVPNLWAVEPLIDLTYGLNSFMDIQVFTSLIYQRRQKADAIHFEDTRVLLGFQALEDQKENWTPDLRIAILEIFPTGNYEKLNPKKKGTDETGEGSYQTGIQCNFQKVFEIGNKKYFQGRFTMQYIFLPLSVNVKGLNAYGGNPNTNGKIYPGQKFRTILAGEYTLTQNWVVALDIFYRLKRHDRFSGKVGKTTSEETTKVGQSIAHHISMAPAIEYNFSENFGIIGGCWFTLAGRNTNQFLAASIAVNMVW